MAIVRFALNKAVINFIPLLVSLFELFVVYFTQRFHICDDATNPSPEIQMGIQQLQCFGHKIPQYFYFLVSGALCDMVQFFIDICIWQVYVIEFERATVCWTLSYILSIVVRHTSHRLLVFGEYEGTYCWSLGKTYLTYSSSIVLSTITNHLLVEGFGIAHEIAWISTMLWTGILNYILLKNSWKRKKSPEAEIETSAKSPEEQA